MEKDTFSDVVEVVYQLNGMSVVAQKLGYDGNEKMKIHREDLDGLAKRYMPILENLSGYVKTNFKEESANYSVEQLAKSRRECTRRLATGEFGPLTPTNLYEKFEEFRKEALGYIVGAQKDAKPLSDVLKQRPVRGMHAAKFTNDLISLIEESKEWLGSMRERPPVDRRVGNATGANPVPGAPNTSTTPVYGSPAPARR